MSQAPVTIDEERLRRLLEVGRSLVSELELETLLRRVLDVARELTGARYAALGILNDRRDGLERFITVGIGTEVRRQIGDPPHGRGVLGVLITDPRPLRLPDVGDHPRSYGFPPAHPPMKGFLGVPIMIRGQAYGNLYLTEKQSGEFTEVDEESVVILADWAAIAIDNARLYAGVEARRSELERAVVSLEATTAIARAVGGETDLERVLELIVKRGRSLAHARTVAIFLEDAGELRLAALAGERGDPAPELRLELDSPLYGEVFRSGRTERVRAGAALLVPLSFRGNAVGVLAAFDPGAGGEFSIDDEHVMESFAASAATAVATAKSVAEDRLRHSIEASEQERRFWARELHDETLQGLAGLRVLLSSALQRGDAEALERAARDAIGHIEYQIEALRALITELRPAALDELGLGPAIDSLVDRVAVVGGFEVETELDLALERGDAPTRLVPEIENAVYRLVQEALSNISKHARADRVGVRVAERGEEITVEIADDGLGFDPSQRSDGFGLSGMRERVALTRGSLAVQSEPGAGTRVTAVLPARHEPVVAAAAG